MEPLLNIAVSAARLAGDIIIRHMDQVSHLKITPKNGNDYFTEVDTKAEQAIINTIRKAYPSHGILAEESGFQEGDGESLWIIDPLDGTTNYMHGFPFYSVSIALKVKNKIEHGVVYDPLRHECFAASRGRGARLNDTKIRVSKQTLLNGSLLATGVPVRDLELAQKYWPVIQTLYGRCGSIRRTGSTALDLAYVASGRMDGLLKFGLSTWDIAAGALLIKEAGGLVSNAFGEDDFLDGASIVAGTPKVFKSLLQTIAPALKAM
ncbi:MAG: inositol monophosphatase [Legionella sp.]|nr:inositol monophosphatase [Legionella sp.]